MSAITMKVVLVLLSYFCLSSAPIGRFGELPESSCFKGCGCSFRSVSAPDGPALFCSNYEGAARIIVDGRVMSLAAVKADQRCQPSRVGERCKLEYSGHDVLVTIKAKATTVCSSSDENESCEVVELRGRFTGQVGDVEESHEVLGECGC